MSQITGRRAIPRRWLALYEQDGLFDASLTFTLRFPAAGDDRGTL